MSLTGLPLLLLVGVATLAAPLVTTLTWRRRGAGRRAVVGRVVAVLGCQALAVATTFLAVNRDFVFYASWGDLLGTAAPAATIQTQDLVAPGQGSVEVLQVHGAASGATAPVLVWRPPQYDQPAYAHTRFPVLMVLPGQPSTPSVMFAHFGFGAAATRAIDEHAVKPFVAVFPPLMTNPPRDTECTDVEHGPKAETWLAADVRTAVQQHERVSAGHVPWAVAGYSTGAFCAVKLMLAHPTLFSQAAGFGGYYQPLTDRTTGNLFDGSRTRYDANSPLWLYDRGGLAPGHRMLLITGRQDPDSYAETERMLSATQGDPDVASLVFPTGGHNYRNYAGAVPEVLRWLGQGGFGG
ncbi:alpha/beta hydrolase-fold protein [Microlunatus spumicola]|uniref:Alpha/beta hydrolase-fold protein n=1 Tax=Microlunatus spumicola TaxID=81499 RepID=A0ABP6YEF9_9ACTN